MALSSCPRLSTPQSLGCLQSLPKHPLSSKRPTLLQPNSHPFIPSILAHLFLSSKEKSRSQTYLVQSCKAWRPLFSLLIFSAKKANLKSTWFSRQGSTPVLAFYNRANFIPLHNHFCYTATAIQSIHLLLVKPTLFISKRTSQIRQRRLLGVMPSPSPMSISTMQAFY